MDECRFRRWHGEPLDECPDPDCGWTLSEATGMGKVMATIPGKVSPDGKSIRVKVDDVTDYQERMQQRIDNQRKSLTRLLERIQELEELVRKGASEVALVTGALVEEQEMYQNQKVLLDRAREERDKALHVLFEIMTFTQDPQLTSEGVALNVPKASDTAQLDMSIPISPGLEAEVLADVESTLADLPIGKHAMPVGEERPTPTL